MKLGLLVIGDGRHAYLQQAVKAATDHCLSPITARLMVNDSEDLLYGNQLAAEYPDWTIANTMRAGMAGAVAAGFQMCADADVDYALWIEEDHVLVRDLPIREAADVLAVNTRLANMTFSRDPITAAEKETGNVLGGFRQAASTFTQHPRFAAHDAIFSLTPCLIPKRVLTLGYDPGNEAGMTAKLLGKGYRFGVWGDDTTAPYCTHIGSERSAGWRL